MKQACDIVVGINHKYIQPAVCKSPTTREVSIEDVEVLPDKLTEPGIRNYFNFCTETHKRKSSTLCFIGTIHAIGREASCVLLGIACVFFHFSKRIHYFQHSYIQRTLNPTGYFHNISVKQNASTHSGI